MIGGVLYIRDYAIYDLTMLRFKRGSKIDDRFYMRGDGTRTYFFERIELMKMLTDAGLSLENEYVFSFMS